MDGGPVVALTHMPWRPWDGAGVRPVGGHTPYAASVLHMSLREPGGYLVVDLCEAEDDHRADLEHMAAMFADIGPVTSEVFSFADDAEGRDVVSRLRKAQAASGDEGIVDRPSEPELKNHVVGITRLPRLMRDQEKAVATALAERRATSDAVLVRLRLAAAWGWLLVEPSLSEERWWGEQRFIADLYTGLGMRTEPRLYSFIDRVHESSIDRLARQFAALA